MSRTPYAARVLIEQVTEAKPKAKIETVGDADGLGVHRTFKVDKTTSKWLAPLLETIGDPRISGLEMTEAGYLHVTFVSTGQADHKDLFPLDAAAEVSHSDAD